MTPGKARLWTGIGCVGTLVCLSSAMLATDAVVQLLPAVPTHPATEFLIIATCFAGIAAVMLPFDLIGGVWIPAAFESPKPHMRTWAAVWLRSVVVQLLFYSTTFFCYLQIGREIGAAWLIAMLAALQFALVAGQELIWHAMTANPTGEPGDGAAVFVKHSDHRFAGGITGLSGFETILIPEHWKSRLEPGFLKVLVARRRIALQTGGRWRGVLAAMLWNITGFTFAIVLSGASIRSVADLMTIFLWFLLFSFVGLLLLPALNRRSVFALDRHLVSASDSSQLQQAIAELDDLTERDPARSAPAESVFQPIPCPDRRLRSLAEAGSHHVVAWNVARTALFLSWAFGGPLARAVHCNVGRPELWALLPAD